MIHCFYEKLKEFGLARYSKENTLGISYNYQPREEISETRKFEENNLKPDAMSEKWSATFTLKIKSNLPATKHWVEHSGVSWIYQQLSL